MRTAMVYNFLIEANLMACLAIVLMLAARRFRKPLGSRALMAGWGLIALRLLCPLALPNPLINEIRSPFAPDLAIRPIAGQIKVRLEDALFVLRRRLNREGVLYRLVNELREGLYDGRLAWVLFWVWIAGVMVCTAWFLWRWMKKKENWRAELVGALCCTVHWFNPLVWLAARLCRADRLRAKSEGRERKPLGILFCALACVLLLGAFSTAEKAPDLVNGQTLPAAFPALSADADDEAVIAHAEGILRMPGFDQPTDGLRWNIIRRAGGWELEAFCEDYPVCEMMLLPTGAPAEYWVTNRDVRESSFLSVGILTESMEEYALALLSRISNELDDEIAFFEDASPVEADGASIYGYTDENMPGIFLDLQIEPAVRIMGFRVEEALLQQLWKQGLQPLESDRKERLCGLPSELMQPYAEKPERIAPEKALEALLAHLRENYGETDDTLKRLEVRYRLDGEETPKWRFFLGNAYDAAVNAENGEIVECWGFGEGNG